jgi:uncharacterized repeat protein (TIGR01451 family)
LPWAHIRVYDPIHGPRPPEEECLHDGGDVGWPVGFDRNGQLQGLGPSDSVAEYTDDLGRRRLAISNRVCICVPRYGVMRTELPPAAYDVTIGVARTEKVQGQHALLAQVPVYLSQQVDQMLALQGKSRPSATDITLGTHVVGKVKGLDLVSAVAETGEVTGLHAKPHVPPAKPLSLCKWTNAESARQGDVLTFYLKYVNSGGQPITDVAVSDSLTGRLEYVPGSAKSDRDAVFTTQVNEAGSVSLRWEIGGRLLPGQSGTVSFQARVR